jgi:21S rRNA (GM2251-2'-O)-methyltransferase
MDKMSGSRPHNGFVLEASALPQPPLTGLGPLAEDYATNPVYPVTLGHQSAEEAAIHVPPATSPAPSASHKTLVVILDQILDPGNLGAILRTVSFLGATAVGITRKGSATLTPVALKASAGASETLTLFSIPALPDFLNASRANGWAVYAAVAASPGVKQRRHMDLHDVEEADPLRKEPCVLLVGNEGEGLSRLTVKKADYEVNIPNFSGGGSGVDSLNVSVAVGLLCSAFLRGVVREVEGLGVGRIGLGLGGVGAGVGEKVKEVLW